MGRSAGLSSQVPLGTVGTWRPNMVVNNVGVATEVMEINTKQGWEWPGSVLRIEKLSIIGIEG
jgi:hypothetical protein